MQKPAKLVVGLIEFSEPTLLLLGGAAEFSWLADQIDARQDFEVHMHKKVGGRTSSLRFVASTGTGRFERQGDEYQWRVTDDEARRIAEQLRQLAVSSISAHAYLEPEENLADVVIMASKDEYDAAQLFPARR